MMLILLRLRLCVIVYMLKTTCPHPRKSVRIPFPRFVVETDSFIPEIIGHEPNTNGTIPVLFCPFHTVCDHAAMVSKSFFLITLPLNYPLFMIGHDLSAVQSGVCCGGNAPAEALCAHWIGSYSQHSSHGWIMCATASSSVMCRLRLYSASACSSMSSA